MKLTELFLANHHLNKTVEVTRVHLFNIITQYKAIFNDDEHSPLSALNRNQHINQNLIFFSWIRNKVLDINKLLNLLYLNRIYLR